MSEREVETFRAEAVRLLDYQWRRADSFERKALGFLAANGVIAALLTPSFGRSVLKAESRKEFRKRCRSDLRQLGELIVRARNGRAPFGEDSSLAIERYSEGRADVGALTGRTRSVALGLLLRRTSWGHSMSAKRAHRILVRGRRARWHLWSGAFVVLLVPALGCGVVGAAGCGGGMLV